VTVECRNWARCADAAVRGRAQRATALPSSQLGAAASPHTTALPLAKRLRRRRSIRSAEPGRRRRRQRRRCRQRDRLAVGETWWLMLAMLIVADHDRSEPSRFGCNTSPHRSDAHRGRTSGGVSRDSSLWCAHGDVYRYGVQELDAVAWRLRIG